MTAPDLRLEGLTVTQGAQCLVNLSVTVPAGEVLTLMAPSGAGKSTALAAILGTLPRDFTRTGRIWLGGREVTALPPHARRIGLLFQDDILFPHLSVGANLAFALPPTVTPRQMRAEKVAQALADAGLAGMEARDPATLSGGQRARVALMRSLLADPCAILLDEPFSRLDAALRVQMRDFVFGEIRARKLPAILVTHDADDARAAGGAVISPLGEPVAL